MADRMTAEQRRRCMSSIHSKDTVPELTLRKALFRDGFRYRVGVKSLPGTPDIVLAQYRTAVFVNGCFWHGHKGCKSYSIPSSNREYWEEKIRRNRERDLRVAAMLESIGWNVLTVWECELKRDRLDETVRCVEDKLRANRSAWRVYMARRKADRRYALAESRRIRDARAAAEREIQAELDIPDGIMRLSHALEPEE